MSTPARYAAPASGSSSAASTVSTASTFLPDGFQRPKPVLLDITAEAALLLQTATLAENATYQGDVLVCDAESLFVASLDYDGCIAHDMKEIRYSSSETIESKLIESNKKLFDSFALTSKNAVLLCGSNRQDFSIDNFNSNIRCSPLSRDAMPVIAKYLNKKLDVSWDHDPYLMADLYSGTEIDFKYRTTTAVPAGLSFY